jgi:hypothetical protein
LWFTTPLGFPQLSKIFPSSPFIHRLHCLLSIGVKETAQNFENIGCQLPNQRCRQEERVAARSSKKMLIGKSKAIETIYEPQDGSVDWRKPSSASNPRNGVSRTLTVSSRTTSRSSSTNGSGNRPRLNTLYSNSSSDIRPVPSSGVGSASVSDASTKGREKTTFQANGKETKAPRGRGGGVPIKRAIDPPPAPTNYRAEYAASYPSSNQKTWLNFKTWGAGKDGMRPYSGFEYVSLTFKAVVLHLT